MKRLTPLMLAGCAALSAQSYWPLGEGGWWELRSGGTPMRFEATGGGHVHWQNPWVKAEFGFRAEPGRILLDTLDMGSGVARMPEGTVYFDFQRPRGGQWSNSLGTMTVQDAGMTVQTPAGSFSNCVAIRARDQKKTDTFWTFCEGVGPVRFGEGKGAFLLTGYHLGGGGPDRRSETVATAPARRPAPEMPVRSGARPRQQQRGTLIGIDANPAASEGYSGDAKKRRARMAVDAGVNLLYLHPKWDEIEKSEGRYDFGDVDFQIASAEQFGLPVLLNVRVIDTDKRSMPGSYSRWSFADPKMADRLGRLLRELAPHTRGRVQWIAIGNEVDNYFGKHKGEVNDYAQLLNRVMPVVREVFPGAPFTVNVTFFGVGKLRGELAPLSSLFDFYSFTYYPLNADLSMREPRSVLTDMDAMTAAAGGKDVILQEIGYASAERLHSSEQAQADFIRYAFQALRSHPTVVAANFVWMSDLPEATVNDLSQYYKASGSDNFRAYIGTLGYFDKNGRAKAAWDAFRAEASRR